jgi:hypothetical protein
MKARHILHPENAGCEDVLSGISLNTWFFGHINRLSFAAAPWEAQRLFQKKQSNGQIQASFRKAIRNTTFFGRAIWGGDLFCGIANCKVFSLTFLGDVIGKGLAQRWTLFCLSK